MENLKLRKITGVLPVTRSASSGVVFMTNVPWEIRSKYLAYDTTLVKMKVCCENYHIWIQGMWIFSRSTFIGVLGTVLVW